MKSRYILIVVLVFLMSISTSSADGTKRVLVIGLDGADWDVINPLIKKDELPHIQKLIKEGEKNNLESSKPSMSPVAWTTFATGKSPGKHGIFSFLRKEGDEFIPLTSRNIKSEKFWDLTSKENLTSIIMNVPMTYPPHRLKGKLISGYLSIENTSYTYPESLQRKIEEKGYKIEALSEGFEPGREDEFLEDLNYTVEKRTEVANYLMNGTDWDVSVIVYTGLDRLQHYFWKYMEGKNSKYEDAIPQHYKKLDKQIGNLLDHKDNNTEVIVLSDHGFGALEGEVYLNHFFKEEGYLKMKGKESFLSKIGVTQQGLISFLKEIHLFEPLKWFLKQIGLYNAGKNLPHPEMGDIDLGKTDCFAANFGGGIYITADNYEEIEEEVNRKLKNLKNPETGEKFFTEVVESEKIYPGETLDSAPDLIVDSPDWDPVGFLGYGKLYSTEIDKSGKHRNTGVLITNFPISNKNNSLHDIAPTVLDLFDLKPSKSMDGSSLLKE